MRGFLPHRQQGVGLIEVLVAMFLLAIGVLGAAGLQLNALKFNQSASERSQATLLAYEIADRMRANREVALSGDYTLAITALAPTDGTQAGRDLRQWREDLARRLPDGRGGIARQGGLFTINVDWSEARMSGADSNARGEFVFVTEL